MEIVEDPIPPESMIDPPMLAIMAMLAVSLIAVVPFSFLGGAQSSDDLAQRMEQEKARGDQLQGQARQIEADIGAKETVEAERAADEAEGSALQGQLVQAQRQIDDLLSRIAHTRSAGPGAVVSAPVASTPDRKLISFELAGNRVLQVTEENYKIERGRTPSGKDVAVLTKKRPGETIPQIQRPDSKFAKAIEKVDRRTEMLSIILRPDSYVAFRKVRELARAAGVDFGWEPFEDEQGRIFASSSGGQKTMLQR